MNGGVERTVAYKEWEVVCDALGAGRQAVLLRKGGIHEGGEGFSFKHERFFLFPTRFHSQASQVRVPVATASREEWKMGEEVPVQFWGEAIWARTLSRWDVVRQLEPFHIWDEELVRERFDCGEVQQIHCALVRVFTLRRSWKIPYGKKYAGCRTWVDLDALPEGWKEGLTPAMSDEQFSEQRELIEKIVEGS